jgi:CBS domain-containing protein
MRAWASDFVIVIGPSKMAVALLTNRDVEQAIVCLEAAPSTILVSQAMSAGLVTIREDATVSEAAVLMERCQVRRVPIVDATGVLLGVLALDDLELAQARIRRAEDWGHGPTAGSRDVPRLAR